MMNSTDITSLNPEEVTVGEIVAKNYHAAGVFRRYGLDFCCGGGISLREACESKNISPEDILNGLVQIPWGGSAEGENYQAWEPAHLIGHIENTHHRFVRTKTEEISAYAAKVAKVHGERHPENKEIYNLFTRLSQELKQHLEAEENTVFPLIKEIYQRRMSGGQVSEEQVQELREQLEQMVGDHKGAGGAMAAIRKASRDYTPPQDACATYRILYQNLAGFEEDLHKHVHLENNILFRKAEKLVSSQP